MIRLLMLAGMTMSLAGCAPSTIDLVNALAKDPNAVCITINSLYGSATYSRNHGCEANAIQVGK